MASKLNWGVRNQLVELKRLVSESAAVFLDRSPATGIAQ